MPSIGVSFISLKKELWIDFSYQKMRRKQCIALLFMNSVPNLNIDERLQLFRTWDVKDVKEYSQLILFVIADGRLPKEFLDSLNDDRSAEVSRRGEND